MRAWIGLVLVMAIAVTGWYFLDAPESGQRSQPVSPDSSTPGTRPESVEGETGSSTQSEDSGARYGLSREEVAERRRHQRRQKAAENRFQRTVAMDGLEPEDVNPGVRELFGSVRLAPVIDPEATKAGHVNGLRLEQLPEGHPFTENGFVEGDRLVRINGVALRDPAEIAHLFARLEGGLELCAERDSGLYCQHVRAGGPSEQR